jgi:hypothetical protein
MERAGHDGSVVAFLCFATVVTGVGLLSLRYGVDSRTGRREL